jgi:hypothetical protein
MLSFTKNRDQPQNRQVCLTTPTSKIVLLATPTPNQNRPNRRPNSPRTPRDRHPDQRSTGNPSAPASRLSFIVVRAAGLRESSDRPNCRPNCGCDGCCPQECRAGLLTGQQGVWSTPNLNDSQEHPWIGRGLRGKGPLPIRA